MSSAAFLGKGVLCCLHYVVHRFRTVGVIPLRFSVFPFHQTGLSPYIGYHKSPYHLSIVIQVRPILGGVLPSLPRVSRSCSSTSFCADLKRFRRSLPSTASMIPSSFPRTPNAFTKTYFWSFSLMPRSLNLLLQFFSKCLKHRRLRMLQL